VLSFGGLFGHSGSAPAPFDALNGPRLAGPSGSHPLHAVRADDLLRTSDGPIRGTFTLDTPPRVGEGLTGTIALEALEAVTAREAILRLVGLRLDEERKSRDIRDGKGNVVSHESWVEANGRLFDEEPFIEPVIPPAFAAGQQWQGRFAIPAPPLGPPSAHLGESIIAWAIEVRWNVRLRADHFAAVLLPLAQNPDLLAAGVGKQGGLSMMAEVPAGEASIAISSPLPARAGGALDVTVAWPGAPSGRGARVELHRRTNAPNGTEGLIASTPVDPVQLPSGVSAHLDVPTDAPPSFDGAGLEILYVIRVLVDQALRPDTAIERPVALV
jgi:hypothetical protein